ncbi:LAS seventeen-binding protein 3 [Smittium mucronatum]|uniref:LAS seventeen-binding protein 3 n=1 Tax=Smittium mucronatum TaxID=133383 RepID=A0A1R0GTN2_9FUNG|nr:LAS seventeen-binding protein 3 [Smittium mucronatum]
MGLHNPIPISLEKDIEKAASILTSFTSSSEASITGKVIPLDILERCKGIAVLTVIKGGFIWSGRAGSGLVVAKYPLFSLLSFFIFILACSLLATPLPHYIFPN